MNRRFLRPAAALLTLQLLLPLTGCRTAVYSVKEKFGIEKRDIMIARVDDAQSAQEKAREQFVDALESFKAVVKVEPGNLEKTYNRLKAELERSESRAKAVTDRIDAVETVARDLFREWERELDAYSNCAGPAAASSTPRGARATRCSPPCARPRPSWSPC